MSFRSLVTVTLITLLFCTSFAHAGQQTPIEGESFGQHASDWNANFTELYPVVQAASLGDAGTLTPTVSKYGVLVTLTCTADPSAIVMTEGGSEVDLSEITIINVGANTCTFADNTGVVELPATITLEQYETLSLVYRSDRWVMKAVASNTLNISTIQGAYNTIQDADGIVLTAGQMNSVITMTGAGDVDIPADQCDSATGQWLVVKSTAAHLNSITSNDASDQFVLSDGTALTAGNELDLSGDAGSSVGVVCNQTNKWSVFGEIGSTVDGGTAD